MGTFVSDPTTDIPTLASVGFEPTARQAILDLRSALLPVYARYHTITAQACASGAFTVINFDVKDQDTANAVTTGGAWKFTASASGLYLVTANVVLSGFSGVADFFLIPSLFKGGADFMRGQTLSVKTGSTANNLGVVLAAQVVLAASEYIDLRIFQSTGANKSTTTTVGENHIEIVRIPGS